MSRDDDKMLDEFLDGKSQLSELFDKTKTDQPSKKLDDTILAQSRDAIAPNKTHDTEAGQSTQTPQDSLWAQWRTPLALAATLMLGLNLAINLKDFNSDPVLSDAIVFEKPTSSRDEDASTYQNTLNNNAFKAQDKQDGAEPLAKMAESVAQSAELATEGNFAPAPQPSANDKAALEAPKHEQSERSRSLSEQLVRENEQKSLLKSKRKENQAVDATPPPAPTVTADAKDTWATAQGEAGDSRGRDMTEAEDDSAQAPPVAAGRTPFREPLVEALAKPVDKNGLGSQESASADDEERTDVASLVDSIALEPGELDLADNDLAELMSTQLPSSPSSLGASGKAVEVKKEPRLNAQIQPRFEPQDEESAAPSPAKPASDSIKSASPMENEADTRSRAQAVPTIAPSAELAQSFAMQSDRLTDYTCDAQALGITEASIKAARDDALVRFDPPYDWRTWLGHIKTLTAEQNYTQACSHLAAFIDIYQDTVPISELPLRMPPGEPKQ